MSSANGPEDANSSDSAQHTGPTIELIGIVSPHEPTFAIVQAGQTTLIDISRTVFGHLLPARACDRLHSVQQAWLSWTIALFWFGQSTFVALPLLHGDKHATARFILSISGTVLSLPALVVATGSLSVWLLHALAQENEFRCCVFLSTLQWIVVAVAFRCDIRVTMCLVEWWVVLVSFAVDADFRILEQRLHCGPATCILMLIYWGYSLFGVFQDTFKPLFALNDQGVSANDILQWTVPTLCVFIMKTVHHQSMCRRTCKKNAVDPNLVTPTRTVHCSTLKARLTLAKISNFGSQRQLEKPDRPGAPLGVPLVRSYTTIVYLDTTFTIAATRYPMPEQGLRRVRCVLLYSTGALSFVATCCATILNQSQTTKQSYSPATTWVPIGSLVGTIVFCSAMGRYYHRELLLELFRSFDVAFSSLQFLASVVLLGELYQWDVRSINLLSWAVWFHWVLCLDALTPHIRKYLRFKKLVATPVILFVLYGLGGPLVLLYGYTDTHLSDRVVFGHIRLSTLLVSRCLTLWLWDVHLVWDIGVRDDSEFIFLKDSLQYSAPSDRLLTATAPGNVIFPQGNINPLLFPAPTISSTLVSCTTTPSRSTPVL